MSPAHFDEVLRPAAILTNCERVAALRAALAIHGVSVTRHTSDPYPPGELGELEALLTEVARTAPPRHRTPSASADATHSPNRQLELTHASP